MTGIQIFKLLPKTDCGECGVPTCLSFAMNLAARKVETSGCPYLTQDVITEIIDNINDIPVIETSTCIGMKVDIGKLEQSDWETESKHPHQYSIWFTSSESPEHCQIMDFQARVTIDLDGDVISKISFLVHSIDTDGKGRTIHPLRLSRDDDNQAAELIREILIAS